MEGGKMTGESEREHRNAVLLTQYQQVCEDLRQLDRLLWQIPSLVAVIAGTLVVVVFTVMSQAVLPAREGVLGIAFLLIVTMSFILLRHRYFGVIAVGTLSKLEKELEVQHVQRTPFPKKFDDMHPTYEMYPNRLLYEAEPQSIWKHGVPGPKLLFIVMLTMALAIVILMIYIIIPPDTVTPPSCVEKALAWIVFGLFFVSAPLIICFVKRQENRRLVKEKKNPV